MSSEALPSPLAPPRSRRPLALWTGIALAGFVTAVALVGPLLAPHSPNAILGPPFEAPSRAFPLGTDRLGRDVLSRLLNGGFELLLLGGVTTAVAYVVGTGIGLYAGYSRSWLDEVLMRAMDGLIALPAILLLLVLAAAMGPGPTMIVIGIAVVQVPFVARLTRTATLEIALRAYVEAAVARGESTASVMAREILPGLWKTIAAAAVPSLTGSILAIAALSFFGIGLQPPSSDWGSMINENRPGLQLQAWGTVAPAAMIAILVLGVNLIADWRVRGHGRSL
jgi:ABC-type dipeptide/oligopeptide/nickel transport system permease subunit